MTVAAVTGRGCRASCVLLVLSWAAATNAEAQSAIDARQFCERTELVRVAILEEAPTATANCEGEPDGHHTTLTPADLAGVTVLDLNKRTAPRSDLAMVYAPFAQGDLEGLTGVRAVYCEGCSFGGGNNAGNQSGARALRGAPDWFVGQIEYLALGSRDLNRIEEVDFFRGLTNLRELSLQRNNMVYEPPPGNPDRPENTAIGENIDPEIWKHLPSLRKLQIGSNRILTLPRGFFRHLSNLEELDMFDMWYEYHPYGFGSQPLPAGVFDGLTRLRRLDLGYNALGATEIADGLFDGLGSLGFLDLRDNPLLERLPASVLDLPEGVRVLTDPGVAWPGDNAELETCSVFPYDNGSVVEGMAVAFVFDRMGDLSTRRTVRISVSESGDTLDGESRPTTVAFRAGAAEATLFLNTHDDTTDEANSRVSVRILDDPAYSVRAASATVTVTDNDDPPPPPPSTGGGGGGGSANRPPVVERQIDNQVLDAGAEMALDIRLNFYDRDQRALDYRVESSEPAIATVTVDRNGVLTINGHARGVTRITVTAADRREEEASQSFLLRINGPAVLPLFSRADDPSHEGFARIINHSEDDGEIAITAFDDRGRRAGPLFLRIAANTATHFNSSDLENGNEDKGLADGVGPGEGNWCLLLESDLDFEALSYIRTPDGFLTASHDIAPLRDGVYVLPVFNPGGNADQVSRLRLVNPGENETKVSISGIDDSGRTPGTNVLLDLPGQSAVSLTAAELEDGSGLEGALGDGDGKWRLTIRTDRPVLAMGLLSSPTGHIVNLSTVPRAPGENGIYRVPFFPSASDELGRQGFLRAINRSADAGEVRITAYDDTGRSYEPLVLTIPGAAAAHFNSNDLELGNEQKGLVGSTGAGTGHWRLELESDMDIDALAFIRTPDGFLTSMHDIAPAADGRHWVATVNPGRNPHQVSGLRLVNPGNEDAEVTIEGTDDFGASSASEVSLGIPAGKSVTLTALQLETGGEGLTGALGEGMGKWRLRVRSDRPIVVMNLLESPTGHLTNLSTVPGQSRR